MKCSFGCGKNAKYFFKSGSGCCSNSANSCDGKRNADSVRKIKKHNINIDIVLAQRLYDSGKSWNVVSQEMDIKYGTLVNVVNRGLLKSRTRSEARKLQQTPKHTEEAKKKISEARIKYLEENPDKVPYLLNHSSKGMSWPEQQFYNRLKKEKITGWKNEFRNGLYSYDFAWPDIKLDVEIDGGTHLQENVKAIDMKRDEWSQSQGWEVIRFTWKDVRYNLDECIDIIKSKIK